MAVVLGATRLYTLLLATVAVAGVILAATLVCCVLRAHLRNARRRRRHTPFLPSLALRELVGQERSMRLPPRSSTAPRTMDTPAHHVLTWEEVAQVIVDVDRTSWELRDPPAPTATHDTGDREVTPERGDTASSERGGDSPSWQARHPALHRSYKLGSGPAAPAGGHPAQRDLGSACTPGFACLDAHLRKLLERAGGEDALASVERHPISAVLFGLAPFLQLTADEMDGLELQSTAQYATRQQMTAAAVCALRMAALAEVGTNPALGATPAPWTLEFSQLMAKASTRSSSLTDVPEPAAPAQPEEEAVPQAAVAARRLSWEVGTSEITAESERDDDSDDQGPGAAEQEEEEEEEEAVAPEGSQREKDAGPASSRPSLKEVTQSLKKSLAKGLLGKARAEAWRRDRPLQAVAGSPLAKALLSELQPCGMTAPWMLHTGTETGTILHGLLCGQRVAVHELKSSVKRQILRVSTLLRDQPHPNVLTPMALCLAPDREAIVLPAAKLCSLEDALAAAEPLPERDSPDPRCFLVLPWRARLVIAYDMVAGLHHLHTRFGEPLVHGSINPASVGLSSGFHACLVDSGLLPASLTVADKDTEVAGPAQLRGPSPHDRDVLPLGNEPAYLDPQYHKRGQFTPPADVYALGVVLLKLLTALPAKGIVVVVKEAYRQDMLEDVLDPSAGEWPPAVAQGLVEFALACCERRHTRRTKLEPVAMFQLQSLVLDAFRLLLTERSITSPTQPSRDMLAHRTAN